MLQGLQEAMNTYHLSEGYILTRGKPETIPLHEPEQNIRIANVIDWLSQKESIDHSYRL
ncbi:hypothetical protein [Parabacteroides sp. Marseille-P3160]|uniref:hypothetical protein n=1 Tax=Parabacteroides sp. Marseille-P3160 TaxID=1917887 RepID=UPI00135810C9|nr:hypothetical protein [Parabacteroides sp. Marseille-P3160]